MLSIFHVRDYYTESLLLIILCVDRTELCHLSCAMWGGVAAGMEGGGGGDGRQRCTDPGRCFWQIPAAQTALIRRSMAQHIRLGDRGKLISLLTYTHGHSATD